MLKKTDRNGTAARTLPAVVKMLPLTLLLAGGTAAQADETDAKRILKAMSDYMGAQSRLSFNYDATLEVVTTEDQILGLASSGGVSVHRPDKLHVSRAGGFADVDISFDGETLTVLGKNLNEYAQVEAPGTIAELVETLRTTYQRSLPAMDLLSPDTYSLLMQGVTDVKDLGSGVVGGEECDTFAFRNDDVDWQIWISQGDTPHPCRYVITTKGELSGLQYDVQFRDWRAGDEVANINFSFENTSNAKQIDLKDVEEMGDLPNHFDMQAGDSQ